MRKYFHATTEREIIFVERDTKLHIEWFYFYGNSNKTSSIEWFRNKTLLILLKFELKRLPDLKFECISNEY